MKNRNLFLAALSLIAGLLLSAFVVSALGVSAQGSQPQDTQVVLGTSFTYQGQLKLTQGDTPANGTYNFQFVLYDSLAGGAQIGNVQTKTITVNGGLFTALLNDTGQFGPTAFTGQARYLEIRVSDDGGASYATLTPRQPLTAAPYAHSLRPGALISGTLDAAAVMNLYNNGSSISSAGLRVDSVNGDGVLVNDAGDDGVQVNSAGDDGVQVFAAGGDGVLIVDAGDNGMQVISATTGVKVGSASTGVDVDSATTGVRVDSATETGVRVGSASTGVQVDSATGVGLAVGSAPIGVNVVNAGTAGTGLNVGTAGTGLNVGTATMNGVNVGTAGTGVSVNSASQDGLFVCRTGSKTDCTPENGLRNGVEVANAEHYGLWVSNAGRDGVMIRNSVEDGVEVFNAGASGLRVDAADIGVRVDTANIGLAVVSATGSAVQVNSATNNGVYVGSANTGVFVDGPVTNWAGFFTGNFRVTGTCTGCLIATFGVNTGASPLQPGDVVALQGSRSGESIGQALLLEVGQAQAGAPVVGVVYGRGKLVDAEGPDGRPVTQLAPRAGAAQPGEYVHIVIYGPMQVKASALDSPIQLGEKLAVGDSGAARSLQTRELDGMRITESAPTIGIALEGLAAVKEGLIWVLVNPQ